MFPLRPGDVYACGPDPANPTNDIHSGLIVSATVREVCTADGNGLNSTSTVSKRGYDQKKLTINGRPLWWAGNVAALSSKAELRVYDVTARALAYQPAKANPEAVANGGDGSGF